MFEVRGWTDYPLQHNNDNVDNYVINGVTFYSVTIIDYDENKYVTVRVQTGPYSYYQEDIKRGYVHRRLPRYEEVPFLYDLHMLRSAYGHNELIWRLKIWNVFRTIFG